MKTEIQPNTFLSPFSISSKNENRKQPNQIPPKYCEIYDLLFYFIVSLKCLINILFIYILLLFLYEVDSNESTS